MSTQQLARLLIVLGAVLAMVGVALQLGLRVPGLGRLPGDLRIQRPGFTLYVPLTTSVVISLVLSGLAYLVSRSR